MEEKGRTWAWGRGGQNKSRKAKKGIRGKSRKSSPRRAQRHHQSEQRLLCQDHRPCPVLC